ncbi:MAG: anti-sigma factor family protein [Anaerolineae bacterium]
MTPTPSFRDIEQLSAYLDGQLPPGEVTRLESRLARDPQLRTVMDELAQSRALLRQLPARRAPRNFTLTPAMAGVRPPLPRPYPALRWASLLATLLLIFTFVTNALAPTLTTASLSYGVGGGGEGAETMSTAEEPPATAEPSLQMVAPPTETPLAPKNQRNLGTPEPGLTQKSFVAEATLSAVEAPPQAQISPPIPLAWQIGLLLIALTCGGMAWILRLATDRKWREKMK